MSSSEVHDGMICGGMMVGYSAGACEMGRR